MNKVERLKFLEETHRMTDQLIQDIEKNNPNSDRIRELKKLKLKYKDEIEVLKNERLRESTN
jgi:hypothetical protein